MYFDIDVFAQNNILAIMCHVYQTNRNRVISTPMSILINLNDALYAIRAMLCPANMVFM